MKKKLLGTIGAAAIAGAMGLVAIPALAAEIDPAEDVSLTIHKYQTPWFGTGYAADGTELDSVPDGATPVEGVTFEICQVEDLDVNSNTDWAAIDRLEKAVASGETLAEAGVTCGTADAQTTDADGMAQWASGDLVQGVYYVKETGSTTPGVVEAAAPFIVTLPYRSGADAAGAWIYDVHVYPKNAVAKISKVAGEFVPAAGAETLVDSVAPWTITANIPAMNDLKSVIIFDQIESRLKLDEDSISVKVNGDPFTDYIYTYTSLEDSGDNLWTILFKDSNGDVTVAPGDTITIDFDTVVTTAIAAGDPSLSNSAVLRINNDSTDPGTSNPDFPDAGTTDPECDPGDEECEEGGNPSPTINFGQLEINKVDKADSDIKLAGAEFYLFANEADADTCLEDIAGGSDTCDDAAAALTTDVDGVAKTGALYVGNNAATQRDYYLVESAAPAGYVLLDTVIEVTVDSTDDPTVAEVENVAKSGGELPMTGASGLVLLMGAAATLAVGAVALMLSARKKGTRDDEETQVVL